MEEAVREVNSHHQLMYHREENRQHSKVATHHREAAWKAEDSEDFVLKELEVDKPVNSFLTNKYLQSKTG